MVTENDLLFVVHALKSRHSRPDFHPRPDVADRVMGAAEASNARGGIGRDGAKANFQKLPTDGAKNEIVIPRRVSSTDLVAVGVRDRTPLLDLIPSTDRANLVSADHALGFAALRSSSENDATVKFAILQPRAFDPAQHVVDDARLIMAVEKR